MFDIIKTGFNQTTASAATGASASPTVAACAVSATNYLNVITHLSGNCSLAGTLVSLISNGTTLWQKRVAAGPFSENFDPGVRGAAACTVAATIAATATAEATVNVVGFKSPSGGA